ncbi:MAG: ABC transporter substrate-binding protein, partial [Actinobacteria bacterium]|nr:ABC transporter substrate-binding protein [Actinomycetota bacterium]
MSQKPMRSKTWWFGGLLTFGLVAAGCAGTGDTTTTTARDTTTTTVEATTTTSSPPAYAGLVVDAGGCDYGGRVRSITAVDEFTVEFDLCGPHPGFLAQIASGVFGIQSQENLEATGGAPLRNPIGTGPYSLVDWIAGNSVVYERFDDYYGDMAAQKTAVLRWETDSAGRLLELQSGKADGMTFPGPEDYATIDGDAELVLLEKPEPNVFYIGFTNTFPPWDDVRVRQAVALGIDRQRIIDRFYPPGSETASHFTPCSVENGCEGESWYEFDVDEAKALLAEAGLGDGFETTIYYRDVILGYLPSPGGVAAEIQAQLKKNLNITAEVVVMERTEFAETSSAGGLDGIHLRGWTGDYPHVTNFLDLRFSEPNAQFGDPYPAIYEALAAASQATDPVAAALLYQEANNAIKELVPMVPVAHVGSAFAATANAAGAYAPPWGQVKFNQWDNGTDTIIFVQRSEPISLYCADETDPGSLRACAQVVEALYSYSATGRVQPQLATDCVSNETLDLWTCSLRQGVLFH